MSKEELIVRVKEVLRDAVNFGYDPQRSAEEIVNGCINLVKEEYEKPSLEDCVNTIKEHAKAKGLDAEVTIKYK